MFILDISLYIPKWFVENDISIGAGTKGNSIAHVFVHADYKVSIFDLSNSVLMPMINEAIYVLFEGLGGLTEIDDIMKLRMAYPMRPQQLADYIGLDVC